MAPPRNLDVLLVQFRFPSMRAGESEVCRGFLLRHGERYDRFDFDFPLGDGTAPGVELPPYLEANTRILGQKHADVIGYVGDTVEIIEAKQRALLAAIGQVIGYRLLYIAKYPRVRDVRMRIIAAAADADVALAAHLNGIELDLYPDVLVSRGGEDDGQDD